MTNKDQNQNEAKNVVKVLKGSRLKRSLMMICFRKTSL